MRRPQGLPTCALIAAMAAVGSTSPAATVDDPLPPATAPPADPARGPLAPPGDAPSYIFLNAPTDLEALWKTLRQPDFVLMTGQALRERQGIGGGGPPTAPPGPWAAVVRSVAVRGEVAGDLASLSIRADVAMMVPGPTWVPLRLDRLTVTEATEGDRVLPLKVGEGGDWEVELRGAGDHHVLVELKVRTRASDGGRDLELAIPEAPTTELRLDVDAPVTDAFAGPDEPLGREPISGGRGTRLRAHLAPRARLALGWHVEARPGGAPAPLLSVQGEVAVDVDPGAFRTRSSWAVRSIRGTTPALELRLDPRDEVLELTLDGQPVLPSVDRAGAAATLTVPLAEPLGPGPTRRLVLATRRALDPQAPARLRFGGFPFAHAQEQTGAVGIAQGGNLWVDGEAGRGLRQIDPRTELPADLRVRPATFLAYQFVDQPFALDLTIEPSPPMVRTEARTTLALGAGRARVDTWLAAEAANGRLFSLDVAVPPGLELESVGPREAVESWQVSPPGADGLREVTARLTFRAQEGGSFSLHLAGSQALDPLGSTPLALFQPRRSSVGGGRIAVLAERDLTVDLADGAGGSQAFRPARQEPPEDWRWPSGARGVDEAPVPALWLRYDGNPAVLPLRVKAHPRTVAHETTLLVQVGRRGVEGRQETELAVHFGTLEQVDVEVPGELAGRWDLDDGDVARRADLGPSPDGGRLVRLTFAEPVTDRARLTFRFRRPLATELGPDRPVEVKVPWLRILEGTAAPVRARVSSESGVGVEVASAGWVRSADEDGRPVGEGGAIARFGVVGARPGTAAGPLLLSATAAPLVPLPSLVASRAWLRTVQGPEGDLRTSASFWIESHDATLSLALPPGAEWLRATVGGEAVGEVEQLPNSGGYRFRLPARGGSGPVPVALEYVVPGRGVTAAWGPPRLLDGVVQQTYWEVRVPWSRAVVGVPAGWTDENQWYWDRYVWKRRPWKTGPSLAAWVGGPSPRGGLADDAAEDGQGDYHSYLFGRPGRPVELRPLVVSRAGLVALCSGPVLGLGVLMIVSRRPPFRLAGPVLLALVLAVATAVQPSVTIVAAQSAMIGVVFTLLAAVVQRLVERPRRGAATVFGEPGTLGAVATTGSSLARSSLAGSDDPTAIRVRPVSTVDHVASTLPEAASGRSSPPQRGQAGPASGG